MNYLLVFIGGGLGSVARYAIAQFTPGVQEGFPYATLLANVLACLILGMGAALVSRELLEDHHRILLLTGFCGGFSTFSTFSAEAIELYAKGAAGQAVIYVAVSLLAGIGALLLGMRLL